MIERIIKILNLPNQEYLMYGGGTGGEFLSSLISSVSPKYQATEVVYHIDKNKTNVVKPKLFVALAAVDNYFRFTKKDGVDVLARRLLETSFLRSFLGQVMLTDEDIEEALELIQSTNKVFLHKMHFNASPYFNSNNTVLLYVDTLPLGKYSDILASLKNRMSEKTFHINQTLKTLEEYKKNAPPHILKTSNLIEQYMKNNSPDIEPFHINFLMDYASDNPREDISMIVNETCSLTLAELINIRHKKFPIQEEKWYKNHTRRINILLDVPNAPISIPMSKMFEYGFLDSIFDIPADKSVFVHREIHEWHKRNMDLIRRFGIEFEDPVPNFIDG